MARPLVTRDQAIDLTNEIFALKVDSTTPKSAKQLDSYDDRNFYLRGVKNGKESEFLLKIYNTCFEEELVHGIHEVMFGLKNGGVVCPVPEKNSSGGFLKILKLPRTPPGTQEAKKPKLDESQEEAKKDACVVSLYTFLPGKAMKDLLEQGLTLKDDGFYRVGQFAAMIANALKDLKCPVLEKRKFHWDLHHFNELTRGRSSVTLKQNKLVDDVENVFKKLVMPRFDVLPKQCIHGDINDGNIIVKTNPDTDEFEISGIIDFGDVNYSCRVFEIAIAASYMMAIAKDDVIKAGATVVAGFHDNCPLNQDEINVVFYCIKARLCQSVCFGTHSSEVYPDNAEYLLYSVKKSWKILEELADISNDDFVKTFKSVCKN